MTTLQDEALRNKTPEEDKLEKMKQLLGRAKESRTATNLMADMGQVGAKYMQDMGGVSADPTIAKNMRARGEQGVTEAQTDIDKMEKTKQLLAKSTIPKAQTRTPYVFKAGDGKEYRATEREGKYFYQKPGEDTFTEIKDTSKVKEYGKDISGARKRMHQTKQAMTQINDYKRWVKQEESQLVAANNVLNELEKPGKLALSMVRVRMPKLFGEVGNLSAFEQQAWEGSPELKEKFIRFWKSKFSEDESLTDKDVAELKKVVAKAAKVTQDRMEKKRSDSLALFRETASDLYTSNPKIYDDMFKGTIDLKKSKQTTGDDYDNMTDEQLEALMKEKGL